MHDQRIDRNRRVSGDDDEVGSRRVGAEEVDQIHLRKIRGPGDQRLSGRCGISADDSLEIDAFLLKHAFLLGDQKRPIRGGDDDVAVVDRRELWILLRMGAARRGHKHEQHEPYAVATSKSHRVSFLHRWAI